MLLIPASESRQPHRSLSKPPAADISKLVYQPPPDPGGLDNLRPRIGDQFYGATPRVKHPNSTPKI
jgi:hypothetical protein